MHRSNFRVKAKPTLLARERTEPLPAKPDRHELDLLREQIENISHQLSPLTANVERLAAPKQDISVPGDIAQALRLAHGRLDRLSRQMEEIEGHHKKMATTFSNALLKLGEKVEKIAGVEDSSFSLAHSLEKLLAVLSSRKLKIIRDSNGDMVAVETTAGTQE